MEDDAVIVETEAIRDAASKAPWVLVVREGRAARQPVELGLRGAGRTEIVSGIAPGEALIPSTQASVREGDRVQAVPTAPKKPVLKGPDIFG